MVVFQVHEILRRYNIMLGCGTRAQSSKLALFAQPSRLAGYRWGMAHFAT